MKKYNRSKSPTYNHTYEHPFQLLYADDSHEIGYYSLDSMTVSILLEFMLLVTPQQPALH